MRKEVLNTIIGVVLGAVLLYFTLRGQPLQEIYDNLKSSRLSYLWWSVVVLLFVFVFRALRWNVMLDNIGYNIKNTHILYYTLFGYLINTFTPKLGEVLRCTALHKDADIPVAKSLGSVIMERVYDVLILIIGLVVIALMESRRLGHLFSEIWTYLMDIISTNQTTMILGVVALLVLMVLGVVVSRKLNLFDKVKSFVTDLLTSVKDSILMKNFPKFLLYTVIIWVLLAIMNLLYMKAIPQTDGLTFYFAVVVLFVGAIGWALPTPNGIGSTHFIILQLFIVFNLDESAAVTFAVLSNGMIHIFSIIFGLIAVAIRMVKGNKWQPVGTNGLAIDPISK